MTDTSTTQDPNLAADADQADAAPTTLLDADPVDEAASADGRKRISFYLRRNAQGGTWMACDLILSDATGQVEEMQLRGRTNPRAPLGEDSHTWDSRRPQQIALWLQKRFEGGYTTFGGPVESFSKLPLEELRGFWKAACGDTDPDVKAALAAIMPEEEAKTIADVITTKGFTIDFTTFQFGQRVQGAETFDRPNGEKYYAREMSGTTDVAFLRTARAANMSVLFYGAPGVGKTAAVEAAFPDVISVDGTGETEVSDFVGAYIPGETPGQYVWEDGPLVRAAEQGVPFFVDELSRINPQVLTLLYPLMDGRGRFTAPGRPISAGGPTVTAKPGFYIIGAYNPNIPGCRIDEPMLSRFALHVELSTCYRLAKILGVPDSAVKCAEKLDEQRRDPAFDLDWAPQLRELIRFKDTAAAFDEATAWQALIGCAPTYAQALVATTVKQASGKAFASLTVGATVEA